MNDHQIAVLTQQSDNYERAERIASDLGCFCIFDKPSEDIGSHPFVLVVEADKLLLRQTGRKAPGPIYAEFTEGAVDHRRKFGGGKGQSIAKAVGIKSGVYPKILDATAGLGKDSFVMASLGSSVILVERSPLVFALLENGLNRAKTFAEEQDFELLSIIKRMELHQGSTQEYLSSLNPEEYPDVIYLDPMFPERENSAEVKKEMAAFHVLVGRDEDADSLLPLALSRVNYRVVVKRPRKAPYLHNQTPSFQLEGKSSRFDIYTLKKMPEQLNSII